MYKYNFKEYFKDLQQEKQAAEHWLKYVSASWDYNGDVERYNRDAAVHKQTIVRCKASMQQMIDDTPHLLV